MGPTEAMVLGFKHSVKAERLKRMKTFRELISWELEQEKKGDLSLQTAEEDIAGRLESYLLRRVRYLNSAAETQGKPTATLKPSCKDRPTDRRFTGGWEARCW